jgi:hypothetical protein
VPENDDRLLGEGAEVAIDGSDLGIAGPHPQTRKSQPPCHNGHIVTTTRRTLTGKGFPVVSVVTGQPVVTVTSEKRTPASAGAVRLDLALA